ncbi:MAG: penicillin-binding protein activator [Deltaproteobacteria bacterium]|nr:penicillin-binding protein activator [Deltaproteobacteria bacterium]
MKRLKKTLWMTGLAIILFVAGCAGIQVSLKERPLINPDEIPQEVQALYHNAEEARDAGRLDDAIDSYQKILMRVPDGSPIAMFSYVRIGEIFLTKGNYEQTIHQVLHVVKRFEDDPIYNEAQYQLSRSYSKLGQYDLSDKIAEKLLQTSLPPRLEAELQAIIGDNLFGRDRAYDALPSYMKALKKKPAKMLTIHVKTKIEDTIVNKLSLEELQNLRSEYRFGFPSGYILYALAISYYESNDMTKATEALSTFLIWHKSHPYYDDALKLEQKFIEMELVDHFAIGCLLPLTGKFAKYGNMALDSILLATGVFDPVNTSPVKLIVEDSKGDPETACRAVNKLATEDRVIGIIGPMSSITALEAAQEAQQLRIPMLTLTQKDRITAIGDYVFRNFLTAVMQVKTLVQYSVQNLGMTSFAILYPEDKYGIEMMNLFWDEVLRWGGEIRGVESYDTKKTDFGDEIKALTGLNFQERGTEEEKSKPVVDFDAIFIPDSYTRVAMIAPQLAFYDVTGTQLLGTNAWNSKELLKRDNEYLEGAIFVDGFFRNSYYPSVRTFIDRFYVAYGREPTDMEALAYDAASIIVNILQNNTIKTRSDLRDNILQLQNYQGITGTTSFLEDGDAQKSLYVLMVRGNDIIQIK